MRLQNFAKKNWVFRCFLEVVCSCWWVVWNAAFGQGLKDAVKMQYEDVVTGQHIPIHPWWWEALFVTPKYWTRCGCGDIKIIKDTLIIMLHIVYYIIIYIMLYYVILYHVIFLFLCIIGYCNFIIWYYMILFYFILCRMIFLNYSISYYLMWYYIKWFSHSTLFRYIMSQYITYVSCMTTKASFCLLIQSHILGSDRASRKVYRQV